MARQKHRSTKKGKHVMPPIEGGVVDKISPLLKYDIPFSPPGFFNEIVLILQNNTDQRLEGWLNITPPPDWTISPGDQLIIAIRPQKLILAEFYLSVPEKPVSGPHFLHIKIASEEGMLSEATFDLRPGLLFVVDS